MLPRGSASRRRGGSREGPVTTLNYHFSGVAGAGMNPLARLMRARGHRVQGSDRALDQGLMRRPRRCCAATASRSCRRTARRSARTSTASCTRRPSRRRRPRSRRRARSASRCSRARRSWPRWSMPGRPGVAISGTCGKSTVTGMVGWLVEQGGVPATVVGGAPRVGEGLAGGFLAGPESGPTIAEACESDGTLTGYHPAIGVVHNVSRDHAELPSLREQFGRFARAVPAGSSSTRAARRPRGSAATPAPARTAWRPTRTSACDVIATGPDRARGVLDAPRRAARARRAPCRGCTTSRTRRPRRSSPSSSASLAR